jgi:hypothetical protein
VDTLNDILPPTGPEVEVLSAMWRNVDAEGRYNPMRLSEVHTAICERRNEHREPLPALSTISSTLRAALTRGLLREMRITKAGNEEVEPATVRSTLHATRSPQTAYIPACEPQQALLPLFRILTEAVPPEKRVELLLELVKEMKLPSGDLKRLHQVLARK